MIDISAIVLVVLSFAGFLILFVSFRNYRELKRAEGSAIMEHVGKFGDVAKVEKSDEKGEKDA